MPPFLDANVIVKAFVDNEDMDNCRRLISENFVTNTACLLEAERTIGTIKGDKARASICIKSLFKKDNRIVSVDKNLLFESIKRAGKSHLNVFDRIHYVTALLNNCSELVSYDKDFDGLEIKRVEP